MKTTEKIQNLLKLNGEMTAKDLSKELKLTTMGVRQHLQILEEQSHVIFHDKKAPRGRPTRYWQLTTESQSVFPDKHQELTLQLIDSIKVIFGPDGLESLIEQREKDSSSHYHKSLDQLSELKKKVEKLADLRSKEGYMATVEYSEDNFWLMENHCPICAAASKCLSFCRSELALFRDLLKEVATVSREEHIVEGARRCSYKIVPLYPNLGQ
ncbi:MAG: transcriptional regulator [Kangiellaceae bacterium]|nr:transcriptional regulator [Kangiellaceae bacterium]